MDLFPQIMFYLYCFSQIQCSIFNQSDFFSVFRITLFNFLVLSYMFSVCFFFLGIHGFWDEPYLYAHLYLLGYLEIFHYLDCLRFTHSFNINYMADFVAVFNWTLCLSKKVETCDLVLGLLTSHLSISCHHLWNGNAGTTLSCANLLAFWSSLQIIHFIFVTICEVY